MSKQTMSITRKTHAPIKVYCLPDERAEIEAMARNSGHSVSTYLRLVGQGYRVTSIVDYQQVQELAKVNGDLGRLGGLLKLWLTDDAKLSSYGMTTMSKTIVSVLDEIRVNQMSIRKVMSEIVAPLAAKNLAAKEPEKILAAKNFPSEDQP
ncbi:conjugal transfer transcriptional regulator TraJ [Alcaligenes faecalis]|uniref:conjugal transfer transcriptional regulator TraJ n=1 Tax=Alcaligenes faecalis TaxID=511 RepID=UPI0007C5D222|nr:conjugal transfer transcriptional regulator TraJ [Alcaligenes faecalis]